MSLDRINRTYQTIISRLKGGELWEVLSHARHYLAGDVSTKALGFLSMPVFTRLLNQSDYGIVSVFMASLGILSPLTTLNISDSISRYFYEKGQTDFGIFLSSIIQFLLILQVPLILLFLLFHERLMSFIGLPTSLSLLLVLSIFYQDILRVFRGVLISNKLSRPYVRVNVFQSYAGFGLSWILVATATVGLYFWRLLGVIAMQILSAVWMMWRIWGYIKWSKINWNHVRYSLDFALPRLPYVLSGIILSQFDRLMLSSINGVDQAGLYSVGYNVGGLSLLIIGAITPALMPNFYQLMNESKFREVDQLNRQIIWIICIAGIILMVFGGGLLRLLADEKFHEGAKVIPAIVMGYILFSITSIYNRYAGFYKKTVAESIPALLAGLLNVFLNWIYLPKYGMIAAAYTTLVSYAAQAILARLIVVGMVQGHVASLRLFLVPIAFTSVIFFLVSYWVF